MNDTTNEPKAAPGFYAGVGSAIDELLQRVGPPEPARQHFEQARIEVLKGLRAIIDQRIETLSKTKPRGTKLTVE